MVYTVNKRNKPPLSLYEGVPYDLINHMLSTANMSGTISTTYNIPDNISQNAHTASKYHDIFRHIPDEIARQMVRDLGIEVDDDEYNSGTGLLHAPLAEQYLQTKGFNEDITEAIRYHTTGKENFSTTGMILLISDTLEVTRQDSNLDKIRVTIGNISLEELYLSSLKFKVKRLSSYGIKIHKRTIMNWR